MSLRVRLPRALVALVMAIATLLALAPSARVWADEAPGEPSDMDVVLAETDAALEQDGLGDDARVIVELFRLVNVTRAQYGLYPLRLDARLVGAAQEHASSMAHAHFCRHVGLDGMSARARIRAHGYDHNNWSGENILCSRPDPQSALDWWLSSAPHRRNLLHGHYTHIGIGYDPAGQFGPSWVLTFGAGEEDTVAVDYLPAAGTVEAPAP